MAQPQKLEPPRIFISHAWEDKALVRQIEKALAAAGAEVWVDHTDISGGDNLPARISDALDWCNTLLLIWSKAASGSRWVKEEWTNAIALDKRVIPCLLEKTVLPSILANKAYIDFSSRDQGLRDLLRALQLAQTGPGRPTIIQLRHTPVNPLSVEAVEQMLHDKDFFDGSKNKSGKGITHQYESVERQGVKLVLDHTTGLTWQQNGSGNYVPFIDAASHIRKLNYVFFIDDAASHIRKLNAKNYGGYKDWRLPTLEEAMSLMEPKVQDGLYLDPVFDRTQSWIWTADLESAGRAWDVSFGYGYCSRNAIDLNGCVRAVRS